MKIIVTLRDKVIPQVWIFKVSAICHQEQQITEQVEFLVIASDGVWDVVTNEVSISFI